ncbi:MAG: GntR family transcriptional regulator [Pseudomonadota bacterium]|nr:GntR family transcriptional regulator [Pseudomonadota bacterium]
MNAANQDDTLKIDRNARTLRELAVERLRDAILRFQFRPGERLVERMLCDRLGVSRTVVREALRHLESEGLVEVIPQQGPAVARLDSRQAEQVYEIRGLLEAEATKAAAVAASPHDVAQLKLANEAIQKAFSSGEGRTILKATTEFYELLFRIADKPVAWQVVQGLNARINHLRAMTVAQPRRAEDANLEMLRIIAAIEQGDGEAAAKASHEHVNVVKRLAIAGLERLGEATHRQEAAELGATR